MSTPWYVPTKPPRGLSVWCRLRKGLPVDPAELLRHRAQRRLAALKKEDREVLRQAILKQLERDLAKLESGRRLAGETLGSQQGSHMTLEVVEMRRDHVR